MNASYGEHGVCKPSSPVRHPHIVDSVHHHGYPSSHDRSDDTKQMAGYGQMMRTGTHEMSYHITRRTTNSYVRKIALLPPLPLFISTPTCQVATTTPAQTPSSYKSPNNRGTLLPDTTIRSPPLHPRPPASTRTVHPRPRTLERDVLASKVRITAKDRMRLAYGRCASSRTEQSSRRYCTSSRGSLDCSQPSFAGGHMACLTFLGNL